MRVKYHDNPLLPLNSGRMSQVASTALESYKMIDDQAMIEQTQTLLAELGTSGK